MEDKELKFESLDDMLDFLAADEQEAIDGYDLVLGQIEDEHIKEELIKLKTEEQAHKDFLETLKEDPTAVYVDPFAEDKGEDEEPVDDESTEEEANESLKEYWWEDKDPMNRVDDDDDSLEAEVDRVDQELDREKDKPWDELDWPEPTTDVEEDK